MTTVNIILLSIVGLLAFLALLVLITYNRFVRSRLRCQEAWSGIDVQLKRRTSLIPNLVEVVEGYAVHERRTLENVIRARGGLQGAHGAAQTAGANNILSEALGKLFAVIESYPELKASDSFMQLHMDLRDVEEKISYARQFYNRNVLDYNQRIRVFPQSVIADVFKFQPEEFFEDTESRSEVRVDLRG